jgi:hypothetical protein
VVEDDGVPATTVNAAVTTLLKEWHVSADAPVTGGTE